jgi:hypothetical protein
MAVRGSKRNTPDITRDEAFARHKLMDEAIVRFEGNLDELEAALGMYMMGRHFGWKVLYIIHSKKTIRKYEEILGISVRDAFDAVGPDADRSNGYRAIQAVSNFWKAISGETPIEGKKLVR